MEIRIPLGPRSINIDYTFLKCILKFITTKIFEVLPNTAFTRSDTVGITANTNSPQAMIPKIDEILLEKYLQRHLMHVVNVRHIADNILVLAKRPNTCGRGVRNLCEHRAQRPLQFRR